jgi:hypothetical protein
MKMTGREISRENLYCTRKFPTVKKFFEPSCTQLENRHSFNYWGRSDNGGSIIVLTILMKPVMLYYH